MRSTVARASALRPSAENLLVERLQLLDRFGLAIPCDELVGEHQPDVVLIGTEIGELLQRAKRLVELAGLLHPVGVLEEVLPSRRS